MTVKIPSLTSTVFPTQEPYIPGDLYKNQATEDPCLIFGSGLEADIQQVFPSNMDKICISGGSVIKITLKNAQDVDQKFIESKINNILNNSNYQTHIEKIKNSGLSGIELITFARTIFSTIFSDIPILNIKNLPNVYISSYLDGNILKNNIFGNTNILCNFKYIPKEILFKIIEDITSDVIIGKSNADIFRSDTYSGINGVSFNDLKFAPLDQLILELFPIFNISSQDLLNNKNILGGYFTLNQNEIILKLPDLSGKNSFGISNAENFYLNNKIYFELKTDKIFRKEIEFATPVNIEIINEIPTVYPFNDISIDIESDTEIEEAYLSIIDTEANLPVIKNINTYRDGIELFTIPNIMQPFYKGNPAFNKAIITNSYNNLWTNKVLKFYDTGNQINSPFDIELSGPVVSLSSNIINAQTLLGEISRPEVILLSDNDLPRNADDRKYFNSKLLQARTVFANARPKVYSQELVPVTWISTKKIFKRGGGQYRITFSSSDFNKYKLKEKDLQFILYARDKYYQFGRAKDILDLKIPKPVLFGVNPDGFDSSAELSPFSNVEFFANGENLIYTEKLIFEPKNQQGLGQIVINKEQLSITHSNISFIFNEPWNTLLFTSNTIYEVFVEDKFGARSNREEIYISNGDGSLIARDGFIVDLSGVDELFFINEKRKNKNILTQIPIVYDNPAVIKIKSKNGYFSGKYPLYAYIATEQNNSEIFKNIDLPNKIININNVNVSNTNKNISIPTSIEYEFKTSPDSNFRRVSNKVAHILLNDGKYKNCNFSALANKKYNFYLVVTNKKITANTNLNLTDYFVLTLGDNESPAFINSTEVLGIVANYNNDTFSTIQLDKNKYKVIYDNFEINTDIKVDINISFFEKISKLAIVFTSDKDPRIEKNTDFYIGDLKINKYLFTSIINIEGNEFVAFFKNIRKLNQEVSEVYVNKNYKKFDTTSASNKLTKIETIYLDKKNIALNDLKNLLSIKTSILGNNASGSDAYFINNGINKPLSDIFSTGLFKTINLNNNSILFNNNIGLKSNLDIILANNDDFRLFKNQRRVNSEQSLKLDFIQVERDTSADIGSFIVDSSDDPSSALAFLRLDIDNANTIYLNKPSFVFIEESGSSIKSDIENIKLIAGKSYSFQVSAVNESFVFIFDNNVVIKPRNVKRVSDFIFGGSFILPDELSGSPCPEIYVSNTNDLRNANKIRFGEAYILDLSNKVSSEIDGQTKKKIPDLNELKELILNWPLNLPGGIKLDQASIPTDLINSFCDMSFHLTADLKIALNGFQVLMTPVQIIFCIIDVICALLNPPKLARAVIRLFQCLYDLVLLLPINSVPVMFISLAAHLLRLLECVFDKVNYLVNAINKIILAISDAIGNDDISALKSLEETLNEYLLELRVSLSVLDPIVSIFSIFIQLLGLVFRFPCSISEDEDAFFCLDPTLIAGLISSAIRNEDQSFNIENLIPVIQSYSDKTLEESLLTNTSAPLIDPNNNDIFAEKTTNSSFIESMLVNEFLRSTYAGTPTESGKINASFSASVTRTRKTSKSNVVNFIFNEKGRNGIFNKKKIINTENNLDSPISLFKIENNSAKVSTGSEKNLYSLNDQFAFLSITNDVASIKPLELTFDVPVTELDEDTGQQVLTGTRKITRTFDNIPSLAVIDDEFNVYFIEKDGITIKDNKIDKIKAKIINDKKAPKITFEKEEQEVDTNSDSVPDAEADVFEFTQIYLFDMRNIAEEIQSKCGFDFFNNDRLENDPDGIKDIVEESQNCTTDYINYINSIIDRIRNDIANGQVPSVIDTNTLLSENKKIEECIGLNISNICPYVVNTLNTQFKVLEDSNFVVNENLNISNIPDELFDGFDISGPELTGAREYANGIGDDAIIKANNFATIEVIPRDSYDNIISADLSGNITLEIYSDSTGTANIIDNNGVVFERVGEAYYAKVTAKTRGIVELRAKICSKVIQAVTYSGLEDEVIEESNECVPKADEVSATGALGELIKIDRILTITFIDADNDPILDDDIINTTPQVFGTTLEN